MQSINKKINLFKLIIVINITQEVGGMKIFPPIEMLKWAVGMTLV